MKLKSQLSQSYERNSKKHWLSRFVLRKEEDDGGQSTQTVLIPNRKCSMSMSPARENCNQCVLTSVYWRCIEHIINFRPVGPRPWICETKAKTTKYKCHCGAIYSQNQIVIIFMGLSCFWCKVQLSGWYFRRPFSVIWKVDWEYHLVHVMKISRQIPRTDGKRQPVHVYSSQSQLKIITRTIFFLFSSYFSWFWKSTNSIYLSRGDMYYLTHHLPTRLIFRTRKSLAMFHMKCLCFGFEVTFAVEL